MYSLPHFIEPDHDKVIQFVKDNPFAFLTGCDSNHRPVVTQVPVFIDEKEGKLFLSGHIMRNTDHHRAFQQNDNVLAVFTGPHTFVSASWYTDKKQGGSWNYMSVHARGKMSLLDEKALVEVLRRTTNHFENNPHSGANFEDLSQEYVDKMIKAIVAFEIEVEKLDHVFKLSQNRDEKSYDNIIEKLQQQHSDAREIAEIMKERKGRVYK